MANKHPRPHRIAVRRRRWRGRWSDHTSLSTEQKRWGATPTCEWLAPSWWRWCYAAHGNDTVALLFTDASCRLRRELQSSAASYAESGPASTGRLGIRRPRAPDAAGAKLFHRTVIDRCSRPVQEISAERRKWWSFQECRVGASGFPAGLGSKDKDLPRTRLLRLACTSNYFVRRKLFAKKGGNCNSWNCSFYVYFCKYTNYTCS
jgi:hypothetical protein